MAAGEVGKSGSAGGTGGRQRADLLVEAADQARGVGAGIAVLQRGDGEGEEAGRIEAGPFGQQAGERAQEQGGADDQDQREGHLEGDDRLAQADAAEAGAAALAERVDQAVAAGAEGGSKATQEAGGYASEEGEGEQAKAERVAQGVGGELVGQERDEPADRKRSHGRAKNTTCHRKEQAIGEKLTADPASGSAESEAGANLAAPCRAAGEKEAGNIQTGEAEQNARGGEQEPQRLG